MYKIVLASHGKLAEGMKESLHFFYEELAEIETVILDNTGLAHFQAALDEVFTRFAGQEILFFTDLLYGTPFNELSKRVLALESAGEIIAGMNLPMVLEAVNYQQQAVSLTEAVPHIVAAGKITLLSEKIKEVSQTDDE